MLVDYLILFAACQAAYVQPDGITLPITSLFYKSLPTNPKEISLSFPNTENIETTNDANLIEPISSPMMTSKYVDPGNRNQRNILPTSMLPRSQIIQTSSPRQIEKSIPIQNLGFNTAATPQVTTLPVINLPSKVENNTLWDNIANNYSPKISSLIGATQNVINNSNNKINLKNSVPALAYTAPSNTYKINNVNAPAIYIDENKQKYFRPEFSTFGGKQEEIHLISEQDKRNQIKNNSNKISEAIFVNDLSNNSLQKQTIDLTKNLKVLNVEKQKMLSNEIPKAIDKGMYPINNIMLINSSFPISPYINTLNASPVSEKVSVTPNLKSTYNKVDLTVTPSVKIGTNKINSSPHQMTASEVQNINNIGVIHPTNHGQAPVPTLPTYFYVPRELPKVYQLPNVYTNTKITPLYSSFNVSPTSPVCNDSDRYNSVRRENIVNTATVQLINYNYGPEKKMAKTSAHTEAINCVPSILKYYAAPTHVSDTPTLSQLPNAYAIPKVTYPAVPQCTETYPSNMIYINMANMSSPKSIDNRISISNLNTEAKLKRPIQPVAGTTTLPLYKPLDSKNIKSLNDIPVPNVIHYQPEYTKLAITPSLESQYSCPSNSIFPTSSDLCGSFISDSLNNIISSFTTGLLSAFYDATTPKENVLSMLSNSEITTNSLTDTPLSKYSETSITLSMPVFLLSPPQLESPSFLPVPKVYLPLKQSENKLSCKKKLKPYISTITINLLPTKAETNDILIML